VDETGTPTPFPADVGAWVKAIKDSDRGPKRAIAFSSAYTPLQANSLVQVRDALETSSVYDQMKKAKSFCDTRVIPQRLAYWRAALWSRGFKIHHPHPAMNQAYNKFSEGIGGLDLLIAPCMEHLSIQNNACLIWRMRTPSDVEYVKFYSPHLTRIDIIGRRLWAEPSSDFRDAVNKAKADKLREYVEAYNSGSSVKKWVDAIKNPHMSVDDTQYAGKVPLSEDDKEYWRIIPGLGGVDDKAYSPVSMKSIFTDIELLQMLTEGDWATAFLIKNMIMVVKVGESITSGVLAGSKRNWAKENDLKNLQAQIEKVGKAQILYGNHTITIEFAFPDPAIFSPEKYDTVIDRICWYFGIGRYMALGAAGGAARGASYAAASWNVQSIRTEARQKRDIVRSHLRKFLSHDTIVRAAFRGRSPVYLHDCFDELDTNSLRFNRLFEDLNLSNIGTLEYSKDNFSTVNPVPVKDVLVDTGVVVTVGDLPAKSEPAQYRLSLTPRQAVDLFGPPTVTFDERCLKEDRQNLAELQAAVQQGPLSNLTFLRDLGFRFEEEMAQKVREWDMRAFLIPIWERNQGLLESITKGLEPLIDHMIEERLQQDRDRRNAPGERGRPSNRAEGERDTNVQPRPSTASTDEPDLWSLTEDELADLKFAVWENLENVPSHLKKLHGVPLTLPQINHLAEMAEGAERGGAKSGWAVARRWFMDNHVVRDGRWVKKASADD
jgi:hypothetical protein